MTNPEILLLVVRLLEREPLTAEQLWLKAYGRGPERSQKTFRRALTDLESFGIPLQKSKLLYNLPDKKDFCPGLARFLKYAVDAHAGWRTVTYGDVDRNYVASILTERERPAEFIWQLLDAALNCRRIDFQYQPQHVDTRRRAEWMRSWFKIGTPKGAMPVSMIPHYLVFSNNHFLLLGEATLDGDAYVRQYEIAGVEKMSVGNAEPRVLSIDPGELYRHSVNVWVGGEIHEVELEDVTSSTGKSSVRKVNGEEEILSFVMASMGKVRILNPPEAIIRCAEKLGLPQNMIFRITKLLEEGIGEKHE